MGGWTVQALRRIVAAGSVVTLLAVPAFGMVPVPGEVVPECGEVHVALAGRVFPEPEVSLTYLRYADEFVPCIALLAELVPERVEVSVFGKSAEGRDLYLVEVTDREGGLPMEERSTLFVDLSMHANERVPAEAGARYAEDLARTDDPALVNLLGRTVVALVFPNPDGWDRLDRNAGVTGGTRTNARGVDLNRNFPSIGFVDPANTPLSELESQAIVELLDSGRFPNLSWVASGHCMTAAPRSFMQILLRVGQYDFADNLEVERVARSVTARIEAEAGDHPLYVAGERAEVIPAMYGTVWETRRTVSTGTFGNYIAMAPPVGRGVKAFGLEGWLCENSAHNGPVTGGQVTAYRAILSALLEAVGDPGPEALLKLPGDVGYLHDPAVVTHESPGAYEPRTEYESSLGQRPYEATRMRFFTDLAASAAQGDGGSVTGLTAAEVVAGSLAALDSFVISDDTLGVDELLLRAWVETGGTLVLTDGALRALAPLLGIGEDAVRRRTDVVVRMDDGVGTGRSQVPPTLTSTGEDTRDFSHPLLAGLDRHDHYGEQLYEPVPLGYSLGARASPWWSVSEASFLAAGGRVAALDSAGDVLVGDVPVGEGRVVVIGGLLPQPTNAWFHPWGLADYSVTLTGWRILLNALGAP
jgi:hypothetical protein